MLQVLCKDNCRDLLMNRILSETTSLGVRYYDSRRRLLWRDQVLKDLEHRGVLVVDAFPDELTAPLINQYLDIKAKHLL